MFIAYVTLRYPYIKPHTGIPYITIHNICIHLWQLSKSNTWVPVYANCINKFVWFAYGTFEHLLVKYGNYSIHKFTYTDVKNNSDNKCAAIIFDRKISKMRENC